MLISEVFFIHNLSSGQSTQISSYNFYEMLAEQNYDENQPLLDKSNPGLGARSKKSWKFWVLSGLMSSGILITIIVITILRLSSDSEAPSISTPIQNITARSKTQKASAMTNHGIIVDKKTYSVSSGSHQPPLFENTHGRSLLDSLKKLPKRAIKTAETSTSTVAPRNTTQSSYTGPKIMLTSGIVEPQYVADTNKVTGEATEIIDIGSNHVNCKKLKEYPLNVEHAVGANFRSIPIVCGGRFTYPFYDQSGHCYFYREKKWQPFLQMIEPRAYAAGIMYNNTFHIFGGTKGIRNFDLKDEILQSSEVIDDFRLVQRDNDLDLKDWEWDRIISLPSVDLPFPLKMHAIASVNESVSIITGGYGPMNGQDKPSVITDLTWYYNHVTRNFSEGPRLLHERIMHGSGYVIDSGTNGRIVVVVGGFLLMNSKDTELLIDGKWQKGPSMPRTLFAMSMVEFEGDLYAIGGTDSIIIPLIRSEIHKLSCRYGDCQWTKMKQELKMGRSYGVAIPVTDSLADCKDAK